MSDLAVGEAPCAQGVVSLVGEQVRGLDVRDVGVAVVHADIVGFGGHQMVGDAFVLLGIAGMWASSRRPPRTDTIISNSCLIALASSGLRSQAQHDWLWRQHPSGNQDLAVVPPVAHVDDAGGDAPAGAVHLQARQPTDMVVVDVDGGVSANQDVAVLELGDGHGDTHGFRMQHPRFVPPVLPGRSTTAGPSRRP